MLLQSGPMRIELPTSSSWIDLNPRQQEDAHTLTLPVQETAPASARMDPSPLTGLHLEPPHAAPVGLTLTL